MDDIVTCYGVTRTVFEGDEVITSTCYGYHHHITSGRRLTYVPVETTSYHDEVVWGIGAFVMPQGSSTLQVPFLKYGTQFLESPISQSYRNAVNRTSLQYESISRQCNQGLTFIKKLLSRGEDDDDSSPSDR